MAVVFPLRRIFLVYYYSIKVGEANSFRIIVENSILYSVVMSSFIEELYQFSPWKHSDMH